MVFLKNILFVVIGISPVKSIRNTIQSNFRNYDSVISMLNDVLGIPVLNARFSLPKQRSPPYELPEFITLDTKFNLRILAGLLSVFRLQLKQSFLCNVAFLIIEDLLHLCSLVVHMLLAS